MKSLFQSENIILVISTDSVQLAHATAGLYGSAFDSTRFIGRFFDRSLTMSPVDPYKVATGSPMPFSSHNYDIIKNELLRSHDLSIRDCLRISDALESGREYCDRHDDGTIPTGVAKALVLPILIFIRWEDRALFESITKGIDYDALYGYASRYPTFNEILDRCLSPEWGCGDAKPSEDAVSERRDFMHSLCVYLYSNDHDGSEWYKAYARFNLSWGLDRRVFKTLNFPSD